MRMGSGLENITYDCPESGCEKKSRSSVLREGGCAEREVHEGKRVRVSRVCEYV